MAFSSSSFLDKLRKLNETQQSVQTLSEWVLFHKTNAAEIVRVWAEEFERGEVQCAGVFLDSSLKLVVCTVPSVKQKLVFIYLCNDVALRSQKKNLRYPFHACGPTILA